MAQKTATFELGANGSPILTSDPGSADVWQNVEDPGDGSAVYSNTHAKDTLAAKIDGGSGTDLVLLEWGSMIMNTSHFGRAYIYPTVRPGGRIIAPVETGIAYRGSISIQPTGEFDLNDPTGVTHASSALQLAINQWTRLEWMFTQSLTIGQIELKIFTGANNEGTIPDEVVTTTANLDLGVAVNGFQVGLIDTSVSTMWWDNVVAGAVSYPGPAAPAGGGGGTQRNALLLGVG